MGSASHYWRLVRVDGTGNRRVEEVAIAKQFFQQQFAGLAGDVPDAPIQRHLADCWRSGRDDSARSAESRLAESRLAEYCLRCFISNHIEQVCTQLDAQFGNAHGFSRHDLFPLVLDDDGRWINEDNVQASTYQASTYQASTYQSLASEILHSFDPNKAALSTWVSRRVRHHKELNHFLLQQGVYLVSDWAILNDTTVKQARRILLEFHGQTAVEIEQASQLLQSYHQVYRRDRLLQRQAGTRGQCLPPSADQLQQMIALLPRFNTARPHAEDVLSHLQTLATQLRQYRVYVRGGLAPTESLDQSETYANAANVQAIAEEDSAPEANEFLAFYREQVLVCLDAAVEKVLGDRTAQLQRKSAQGNAQSTAQGNAQGNPQSVESYLTALHLFHCQGQSMGQIASQIGLQAQYQVTRLMKLKELRADIRQRVVQLLSDRILDKAQAYVDAHRLKTLDQQLESLLDEQISQIIQQAEAEASISKQRPLSSLFARRLCRHLETRRINHDQSTPCKC
ncbi:MAG TPA: hypothetical protein V6C88_15220 [Chroococcidiopsis sp.]